VEDPKIKTAYDLAIATAIRERVVWRHFYGVPNTQEILAIKARCLAEQITTIVLRKSGEFEIQKTFQTDSDIIKFEIQFAYFLISMADYHAFQYLQETQRGIFIEEIVATASRLFSAQISESARDWFCKDFDSSFWESNAEFGKSVHRHKDVFSHPTFRIIQLCSLPFTFIPLILLELNVAELVLSYEELITGESPPPP
jgi:hypothetical protein